MAKQGKYLPGSHIPVIAPSKLDLVRGDHVIIFPWNIANEVRDMLRKRSVDEFNLWVTIPNLRRFAS